MNQVLFDDLINIGFIDKGVPDLLGVDHDHRPLATAIETTGAVDTHLARLVNAQLLTTLLGVAAHRLGVEVLTAAPTVFALIDAEKDVMLIKTHMLYIDVVDISLE